MDDKDKRKKGKKKRADIVSTETGEVTSSIYEGDRLLREKSIKYLKENEIWKIEHFYKGHTKELRKLMDDLDVYEKAFLFTIAPYVQYNDCHLCYDNGKDLNTEDLIKLSGLSRNKGYEVLDSLINMDILYKGKNSRSRQYFMNPWLFAKGNRINKVLKTMFKNYHIRVLGGIPWKDI